MTTTAAVTPRAIDGYRGGSGEPLVLVHGAEASWRVWRPVLDMLSAEYDVRAILLPGHNGGLPLAGAPITLDTFADSLEAYLDAEGLADAHFCGNSLGGIMAMEMVRRGRARSAVSVCGPAAAEGQRELKRLNRLFLIANLVRRATPLLNAIGKRSPRFRKRMLDMMMVHGDRLTREEFTDLVEDPVKGEIIAVHLVRSVIANGFLDPLDVGEVPMVVVWGEQDKTVPWKGYGEPAFKLLSGPGAELRMIPDAGHTPMWDAPQAVVDAIRTATSRAAASA